jgi:hypothetical protein
VGLGWPSKHIKTFTRAVGFQSQTTYLQLFKQTWYVIHKQDEEMNYCRNITEMLRLLIILNCKSIVLNPDSSLLTEGLFPGKKV